MAADGARHANKTHHATLTAPRVLDVGRGIAIVLVIYGHALSPWVMDTHGWFLPSAFAQWKFGASFLMPFFFALSGMSWRCEKTFKIAFREALSLIFTAVMASVIMDVVRAGLTLGGVSDALHQAPVTPLEVVKHAARMLLYGDFYSISALWFVGALALTRLLASVTTRLGAIASIVTAIVLIAAGLAAQMFMVRNYDQIYLLGGAFSFFMLGHAARHAFERALTKPLWLTAASVIGGIILFTTFGLNEGCTFDMAKRCGIPTLNNEFGVAMIYGAYGNLLLFAVSATAGVVFGLGVATFVTRFGGVLAVRFHSLGRSTLNLLIINGVVLELVNPQVQAWIAPKTPNGGLVFFLIVFVLSLATTLGSYVVLRKPLKALRAFARNLAQWPVEWGSRALSALTPRSVRVSASHELPAGTGPTDRRAL
ncbi:MAG: acyltransferase [Pseudomonadota bacterium]